MSKDEFFDCRICQYISHIESPFPQVCLTCFHNKPLFEKWIKEHSNRIKKDEDPDFS